MKSLSFLAILSLLGILLSSCNKEGKFASEDSLPRVAYEVTLKGLTAEISDDTFRAANFVMGANSTGGMVPLYKLEDGATVIVNTGLSHREGKAFGAAALKWKYKKGTAESKPKLVLEKGTITITSEDDWVIGSKDWFLTGIWGGTLNQESVVITPTTELIGVNNANPSGNEFALEVPYGFPWTPVEVVQTGGGITVGEAKDFVFRPLGTVIGYQLGNNLGVGTTLAPTGFMVFSDGFAPSGFFTLKATSTRHIVSGGYPRWLEGWDCSAMDYTFSPKTPVGVLAHGQQSKFRYYAWVMPRAQVTRANTYVVIKGSATGTNSWGNLWKSNYVGVNMPKMHTAYTLKANAASRVLLPLEAVTEYNLAGGEDLAFPELGGNDASKGALRFANRASNGSPVATPHYNDASGYYNAHIVSGNADGSLQTEETSLANPNNKSLKTERLIDIDGSTIILGSKYFVPTDDHYFAVFPGFHEFRQATDVKIGMLGNSDNSDRIVESFRLGDDDIPIRLTAACSYSNPIVTGGKAEVYALRFMKPPIGTETGSRWKITPATGAQETYLCYPLVVDNNGVCAFRYTYTRDLNAPDNGTLTAYVKVEMIYLGEAGYNELTDKTAAEIKAKWVALSGKYPFFSRTFPAAGYAPIYDPSTTTPWAPTAIQEKGLKAMYWTSSIHVNNLAYCLMGSSDNLTVAHAKNAYVSMPVRLFRRH